ncbi:hypothetical protein DICPUDRAFT_42342 [Dictyostelium purpureum]|uniref:Complex 1 LYR protein domain-containing protein n=1 Tax=Dictyostelium purpureum TaxID=5786 RepID=F1A1V4_DICPU|nr:uncharacterized protein DICPUDRAFT_42342 [Dictyostelium purpureum]EGC29825.1 hypothetical protein DICPUDRAFT_42342 [Dictyostelium purpureum]|eukprot:XP_003293646.1 hypothetical protein DICPUDRAFT_42342 [Dictyostelium purpureum]
MSQKEIVLHLYRSFLRASNKFSSYNFREYALRRVATGFRENKNKNESETKDLIKESMKDLEMVKRQSLINSMYSKNKLVVE